MEIPFVSRYVLRKESMKPLSKSHMWFGLLVSSPCQNCSRRKYRQSGSYFQIPIPSEPILGTANQPSYALA